MTDSTPRRDANSDPVAQARRRAAIAQAELAEAALAYADLRRADHDARAKRLRRASGSHFAADELSLVLRDQPYTVRCLLARTRRLTSDLPSVWQAFRTGEMDAEQVRVTDRVARRVTEPATMAAIDGQAVDAAHTRTPKQLQAWLLRLVVSLEPLAFAQRHRRALAERRVTIVQGVDGIGYVTGEVTAADAAAIDATLAAAARTLGGDDPRTDQQRRADLFADLLLGRLQLTDADHDESQPSDPDLVDPEAQDTRPQDWLEVEDIDPDTGELLTIHRVRLDPDGETVDGAATAPPHDRPAFLRRRQTLRIGVIVPLSSLLGASHTPGELPDRSGLIPADVLRALIADTLHPINDHRNQVLFTRLLTDDHGRLLQTTELGRHPSARLAEAVSLRAGTCTFPTCTVPAERCDLDHHQPWPTGPTDADNLDPLCRRHHRAKTHAWLASRRDDDAVEWTLPDAHRYRCTDPPLLTGAAA